LKRTISISFISAAMLAAQTTYAADSPVDRGRMVYEHWCAPCHAGGKDHAGTMALQEKYQGALPAELSKRVDLRPEFISYFLRNGVSLMPFFRKTEITPAQEKDLIAFLTRDNR
jgi:mono/diheme cytochrome c family protein